MERNSRKMNSKKVGIITINDYNYGNRLQNYALQQAVRDIGREPESIYFNDVSKKYYLSRSKSCIHRFVKFFTPIAIIRKKNERYFRPAQRAFDKFTEEYISSKTIKIKRHKEINKAVNCGEYYCFLAGSDQIWNPKFAGNDYYFLTFAEDRQKKSYAASIGFKDVPESVQDKWEEYWNSFEEITVREESAAKIIDRLTGKKPKVVLDPTLLVEKKIWDTLSDEADVPMELEGTINKNYIFMFFIGDIPEEAEKYKNDNNYTVVDISDERGTTRQKVGPIEFVKLVRNAQMILTDSYHCLVFAVIYQKKYKAYQRNSIGLESMTSRMEELFNITGLGYVMESEEYEDVNKRLESKRKESYKILRQMIE